MIMETDQNFFIVRAAISSDSRRIWEIRNYPQVRQNSNNSTVIAFSDHDPWFQAKYFSGADNFCFVLTGQSGDVIGYCRFDYNADERAYVVSIALDPAYQGRGLGGRLLRESLLKLPPGKKVVADIKKDNIASLALFLKNNFFQYRDDGANIYLVYRVDK